MRTLIFIFFIPLALLACGGGSGVKASSPVAPQTTSPTPSDPETSLLNNVSFSSVTRLPSRQPDQQFIYGSESLQYGDVWLPQNTSSAPMLVFIHGGCWSNAYRVDHSYPLATALADDHGIAVLSLEYRATGDEGGGWPGTYEDILLALGKLSTLSSNGVDTQRMALAGHSAGGHLALLAASQPEGSQLKAVFGLAAIADFVSYAEGNSGCQLDARAFIGKSFADNPDAYHAANPTGRTMLTDVLLLQGGKDNIVDMSNPQSTEFPLQIVEDAGHFDWIHPESAAFALFVERLKQRLSN